MIALTPAMIFLRNFFGAIGLMRLSVHMCYLSGQWMVVAPSAPLIPIIGAFSCNDSAPLFYRRGTFVYLPTVAPQFSLCLRTRSLRSESGNTFTPNFPRSPSSRQ